MSFTTISLALLKAIGTKSSIGLINWSLKQIDPSYNINELKKKLGVLGKSSSFESIYSWTVLDYALGQSHRYNPAYFSQEEVIGIFQKYLSVNEGSPFDKKKVCEEIRTLLEDAKYRTEPGNYGFDRNVIAYEWGIIEKQKNTTTIESEVDALSEAFNRVKRNDLRSSNLHQLAFSESLDRIEKGISNLRIKNTPSKPPKDLTDIIPRRQLNTTIGREAKLKELRSMLLEGQKVAVVNGMGGIGKTTLAATYLEKHYEDYAHVAWITQKDENLEIDFATQQYLLKSLGVDATQSDPKQLFQEIVRSMKSLDESPCLLVIDNALGSIQKYHDFLPKGPNWHLLITSRSKPEDIPFIELGKLSPEKALELFEKNCPRKYDQDRIKKLLKNIEHHTLTVELLSKTAYSRHLSIEQLETALPNDQIAEVSVKHSQQEEIDRVTSYLSKVFALAELSPDEIWVLKQWTCLPLKFIPFEILQKILNADEMRISAPLGKVLNSLTAKGFLQDDQETDSYKIHALIADIAWTNLQIGEEDVSAMIENLTHELSIDEAKDNPIEKFVWEPYGSKIDSRFEKTQTNTISDLQNDLAIVLRDLGDYQGAKALLEKAMASNEKNVGPDHPTTAVSYSNLALVFQNLGDYQGAKALLEKAMASNEKNFGPDHPITAVSYSNLALVFHDLGDYQGAKYLLEKALASDEKNFGPDHPAAAKCYSNLATVLRDLGDYQSAKALLEKAMASDEKNFGANDPRIAVSYSNLALVLQDLGDYQGAKALLEKAMAMDKQNFGPDHPTTSVSYSNLATVMIDLGDYHNAKALLEKTIAFTEKNFGPDHPATAGSYSNLAMVLQDLGDYQGAKALLEKAMASAEKNLGPDHPTTAGSYSNLATVLKDLGDYQGAKVLLEKAKASAEKNLGPDHPTTAVRYSNLAMVLKDMGDFLGAKALLEKTLSILKASLPEGHPFIERAQNNLKSVQGS